MECVTVVFQHCTYRRCQRDRCEARERRLARAARRRLCIYREWAREEKGGEKRIAEGAAGGSERAVRERTTTFVLREQNVAGSTARKTRTPNQSTPPSPSMATARGGTRRDDATADDAPCAIVRELKGLAALNLRAHVLLSPKALHDHGAAATLQVCRRVPTRPEALALACTRTRTLPFRRCRLLRRQHRELRGAW